jgi:outer membrane autotransporter protein
LPSDQANGGLWVAAFGQSEKHEGASGFGSEKSYAIRQDNYRQKTYGLMGGADFGVDLDADKRWLFGALAGFYDSNINYAGSGANIDADGFTVGAYSSLLSGGLFMNSLLKADFVDIEHKGQLSDGKTDATSFGMRSDAGYSMRYGNLVIEPQISSTYTRMRVDNYSLSGALIPNMKQSDTEVGTGLRFGFGNEIVTASLTGKVWFDLDKDDVSAAAVGFARGPGQYAAASTNAFERTYGDIAGDLAIALGSSTSLFARAEYKFNKDSKSIAGSFGIDVKW